MAPSPSDVPPSTRLLAAAPLGAIHSAPLAFLDLGAMYGRYWPIVDCAVFATIFVGLAHATVGRRFEGKGGELVTVGVGAALSIGAVGAEWAYGFTLASLAPVATLVVFALLAVVLVQLLVALGCRLGTAVAVGMLLLGACVSLISPQFGKSLDWLQGAVQLAAVGGVLFLVGRGIFGHDGVRGGERLQALGGLLKKGPAPEDDPAASWLRKQADPLKAEKRSIAGALKPIARQETKAARRVLSELRLIDAVLARGPPSPEDRQAIASALARIPPARHELVELVRKVREKSRSLQDFDNRVLREAGMVSAGRGVREGSALYRVTVDQKQKIELERRLEYLESFVEKYDRNAGASIQRAAELLLSGDIAGARKWLDEATKYEEEVLKMIERTRSLEGMLVRVTRREARQARKAS